MNIYRKLVGTVMAVSAAAAVFACTGASVYANADTEQFQTDLENARLNAVPYGETGLYYTKIDSDNDGEPDFIVIADCDEQAVEADIPSEIDGLPVTNIGTNAFEMCGSLKSVNIPESIRYIGYEAFGLCRSLESIVLPDSLEYIDDYAFAGCCFKNIVLPAGLKELGRGVFANITSFEKIEVVKGSATFTAVGGVLFNKDKTELICYPSSKSGSKYTVPDGVAAISDYAFDACTSLKSVTFPDGLKSIGQAAFIECTALSSVKLPDSLEELGTAAFGSCDSLEKAVLSPNIVSLENAFGFCRSLKTIVVPEGITNIDHAFQHCSALTDINIPESVTEIGVCAFSGCTSLKTVTIPETVTAIDDFAFDECSELETADIPASVSSIGNCAFFGCKKLTDIYIRNAECLIYDSGSTVSNEYAQGKTQSRNVFDGTVHGHKGSTAQQYAEKYGYKFKEIDAAAQAVKGDSNGDGIVNVRDAAHIAKMLALGKSAELPLSADFNGDGKINVRDAAAIAGYLAAGRK